MNELHKVDLPQLPLSRQVMNPVEWLKIQFGYVESEARQKSRYNSTYFSLLKVPFIVSVSQLRGYIN